MSWTYDERSGIIGSIWDENGDQVAQACQMKPVHGPGDLEERREHARLIAAAPDLLELAQEVANHLYTTQDIYRVREMARAVIAKAEPR